MSPRGLAGTLRSPVRVMPARSNLTGRGASMSELVLIASHSSIWRTLQDRLPQVVPDRHRSSVQARSVTAVLSASVSRRGSEGRWNLPSRSSPKARCEGWRRERDSNPRYPFGYSGFQDHRHRPLGHPSAAELLPDILAGSPFNRGPAVSG